MELQELYSAARLIMATYDKSLQTKYITKSKSLGYISQIHINTFIY